MTYAQLKAALDVLGIVDATMPFVTTLKSGTQYKGTLAPEYFLAEDKGLNIDRVRGVHSCIVIKQDDAHRAWCNVIMTSDIAVVARELQHG